MPRKDGVDDLGNDRVFIADDAGERSDRLRASVHIRFSRISSLTLREARRCSENGLSRNSPRVWAMLMVGTPKENSLKRIIPLTAIRYGGEMRVEAWRMKRRNPTFRKNQNVGLLSTD